MPITSIQTMSNNTQSGIVFINTEGSGNNREIDPDQTISVGNCWIPWCGREQDFPAHHIQIQDNDTDKVLWFIWQDGDTVRASQAGFAKDAPPIAGVSRVGSSLAVTLLADGSLRTNQFG